MTGFCVPKMVPKILQANLIFYVVFATLASQTVLAEKLKSSPRRQQSGFNKTAARSAIVTCFRRVLKHVTNARRATRKCQISLSHKPGTVETVRFPRKMLLEQGWT